MQIDITSNSELFIKQKLLEGDYSSPQEIIDQAIKLLQEKELVRNHRISQLNTKLEAGLQSLQSGKFITEEQINEHFRNKFGF